MTKTLEKYKDSYPLQTISRIRNILTGLDIVLAEQWQNEVNGYYSLNLNILDTPLYSNGKGTTPEYALASAYAELMERIQNFFLKGLKMYLCPSMLDYGGFSFAPDEKRLSIDELIDAGGSWLELFTFGAVTREEKRKALDKWLIETSLGKPSDFIALPFLKISDGSICYIPENMVLMYYGSNGMCAGNTKEEALVQGISEVMERYANIRIIKERLTPPTVPDEYIRKFPSVFGMIERIKEKGNYRIIVKDCSLGEGFPVVGIIFADLDTNSYFVKLGAHPVFEIALERCLTELLQGRKLDDRSWMTPFSYQNKNEDSINNILSVFISGEGSYPVEFFENGCSYEFSEPGDCGDMSNREMLSLLIGKLREKESEIYLRDVSFLGFPSFQIIINGMSEGYSTLTDIKDLDNKYCGVEKISKRLCNSSDKELEKLIEFIYEFYSPESLLTEIIDAPLISSFPWYGIKRDLLLSALFYRLRKFKQAYAAMEDFIAGLTTNGVTAMISYYKCTRDYIGARSENMDESSIRELLGYLYPVKLIDRVITGMSDPSSALLDYPQLNCYECEDCKYTEHCFFAPIKVMYKKLKYCYGHNGIDQRSNMFLSDIYNNKHAV